MNRNYILKFFYKFLTKIWRVKQAITLGRVVAQNLKFWKPLLLLNLVSETLGRVVAQKINF